MDYESFSLTLFLSPNAYGVSCRVRAMRVALPTIVGLTPCGMIATKSGSPVPIGLSDLEI